MENKEKNELGSVMQDLDNLQEQVNAETNVSKMINTNQENVVLADNSAQNVGIAEKFKSSSKPNKAMQGNKSEAQGVGLAENLSGETNSIGKNYASSVEKTTNLQNSPETQNSNTAEQANIKSTEQTKQSSSYGIAALILGIFAVLFGILLIISVYFMGESDALSVAALIYLIYIGYILGIFCGTVCGIIAGIMSIVAICKSNRRMISWVGFGVGVLSLVFIIILVGYVLLS